MKTSKEPDMPTAQDPREWTGNQYWNFVEKWGRDKYVERLKTAMKKEKEKRQKELDERNEKRRKQRRNRRYGITYD